jgi:hypothetical protein
MQRIEVKQMPKKPRRDSIWIDLRGFGKIIFRKIKNVRENIYEILK